MNFFYLKKDPITIIANSVYLHRIGTSQEKDKLIFEEKDQEFDISISRSASTEYILINSESTDSNEYYFVNLSKPEAPPRLFLKRKAKHLYYLEHYEKSFYLRSNLDAPNFKLLAADDDKEFREDVFEEIVISGIQSAAPTISAPKSKINVKAKAISPLPEIQVSDIERKRRR